MAGVKRRRAKIIKDKKKRGEWAESVFIARASEEGLPASKPWGDSRSFDCVIGHPGKFLAIQVKCTIAKLESGEGYICSTCSSHKPYAKGSFDFLAAYVIPEDLWYIIPGREVWGLKSISLCTVNGEAKYEPYREAWGLLRKASEMSEPERVVEEVDELDFTVPEIPPAIPLSGAVGRMVTAMSYFRHHMRKGGVVAPKREGKE